MNTIGTQNSSGSTEALEEDRFLVFTVGAERFATPLLSVREIVEPLPFRPVPNPHDYYLGLANLRGQIVGVLDLGIRLGFSHPENQVGALLVFDIDGIALAAMVSTVESVIAIPAHQIERGGKSESSIPSHAMIGIAHAGNSLVPIIDLTKLLEKAEPNQRLAI